ncbi:MAG: hypothetical protein LBC11_01635 [Puniceicoccales bacterium]|jgi:hypothetical protein|nr:hypothetical protein [Puniceicoccales bacterium]
MEKLKRTRSVYGYAEFTEGLGLKVENPSINSPTNPPINVGIGSGSEKAEVPLGRLEDGVPLGTRSVKAAVSFAATPVPVSPGAHLWRLAADVPLATEKDDVKVENPPINPPTNIGIGSGSEKAKVPLGKIENGVPLGTRLVKFAATPIVAVSPGARLWRPAADVPLATEKDDVKVENPPIAVGSGSEKS